MKEELLFQAPTLSSYVHTVTILIDFINGRHAQYGVQPTIQVLYISICLKTKQVFFISFATLSFLKFCAGKR